MANKRKLNQVTDKVPAQAAPVQSGGPGPLVTVAVPASLVSYGGELMEQQVIVAGQIARALLVFGVHAVVVYEDNAEGQEEGGEGEWLCRVLEYLECPPSLRRQMYPREMAADGGEEYELIERLVGRLDGVHHVRTNEWTRFREGVVGDDRKSVDLGLPNQRGILSGGEVPAAGMRVTFEFDKDVTKESELFRGRICDPVKPIMESHSRMSWGYTVQHVQTFAEVFSETSVTIMIDYNNKQGNSLGWKKLESTINNALTSATVTPAGLLLVIPPLNRKAEAGGRVTASLNVVEMSQSKYMKVDELLWSSLSVLRPSILSYLQKVKQGAAASKRP